MPCVRSAITAPFRLLSVTESPVTLPPNSERAMTPDPKLFDIDSLIDVRLELLREARALRPGPERNQKRQVARSLKRLIKLQRAAQAVQRRASSH
jgi:hypothetical protein